MKKLLLITFMAIAGIATSFAQGTVTGTVVDADLGGALPGANVLVTGTTNGTITDFDGNFTLNVTNNSGTLTVSYVGFTGRTVKYTVTNGVAKLGSVSLSPDAASLDEVIIVGSGLIDVAENRRTPVAVSTITANEIQERVVGNVEIAEALKYTPSAYVSGQTGFGDSQFFLRGFDQTNVAVLLNGQPVNGVEDGRVYWSNWSGVADIATAIQVQRGLGSSKLAISSVGGTTNIIMKAADKKAGGFVRFLGANDSYFKGTVGYNTGVSEKGWAFSVLLDHWQAHRKWAQGTYGEGQNYFFAVGYKPSEKHAFNFLVTGAPQKHGQRWSQSKEIIEANPKYNQHWGYTEDGIQSERQNYYHKPVMNLNWDWTMNDDTDLSTVAYASWGRGGGTGPRGDRAARFDSDFPNVNRMVGQIDYPTTIANNAIIGLGDNNADRGEQGYIRRSSVNNHQWYGLLSNLSHNFSEKLTASFGVDGRLYTGDHFRQVSDLYGLSGWANDNASNTIVTNTYDPTPWSSLFNFADEADRIDYDYSENINYGGVFGQLEYAADKFSVFFQGAFSSQSYERISRFNNLGNSDKISKTGYNIKGGVSYDMAEHSTIFLNAGKYSRQPFLDNIFQNIRVSNDLVQPDVENEEIVSYEAGYHFQSGRVKANFNAYVTDWDNRTLQSGGGQIDPDGIEDNGDEFFTNVFERGVRQYHAGAEFDIQYRATDWLKLTGFASGGSWTYKGESSFQVYNNDTNELVSEGVGVDRTGIKVSTAPQTTAGFGFVLRPLNGLSLDGNIVYQANHYEFTDLTTVGDNPEKLDAYSLTDFGLTYKFDLGSNKITLRGNVFNAFDQIELQNTDRFGYFNTNGRTFNASVRYEF